MFPWPKFGLLLTQSQTWSVSSGQHPSHVCSHQLLPVGWGVSFFGCILSRLNQSNKSPYPSLVRLTPHSNASSDPILRDIWRLYEPPPPLPPQKRITRRLLRFINLEGQWASTRPTILEKYVPPILGKGIAKYTNLKIFFYVRVFAFKLFLRLQSKNKLDGDTILHD